MTLASDYQLQVAKGEKSDGHKHQDVVDYHQRVFLLTMAEYAKSTRKWDDNGVEIPDESIFYAHDHHKVHWIHNSETAKPYAKGDSVSFMVADFISADYGWG